MTQRSTTTTKALSLATHRSALVGLTVALVVGSTVSPVLADQYQDQINQLEAEAAGLQATANQYHAHADTLQGELDRLRVQSATLRAEITLNENKLTQLQTDIAANEKKLDTKQRVLGVTLADMYVDSDITPIEMLASSKNIGDYIDKQEARATIRAEITNAIGEIKKLKSELLKQKEAVEASLRDQAARRDQLAASETEQARLVNETRGIEAAYQAQVSDRNSQVRALRAAQAAANRARGGRVVAGDPGRGGYPADLYSQPLDATVDPWGMYNRECVSYTAWKVYQKNGYMPYWGGHGNANQWPSNARAAGIPVSSVPRVGSVAIWTAGTYGHAMWVEAVNGDGTVVVSQFNYAWDGEYSEMTMAASSAVYIYF